MRKRENRRFLLGSIFSVLATSMAFLSCQKEDVDEFVILEQGNHETIVVVTQFDCELLQLNIGDTCLQEQGAALITGFVSQDCECFVNQPCGINIDISSSPDDGTGNGQLESYTVGGIGPYSYSWYHSGVLVGSEPLLDALDFGVYQLIVYDSDGCSTASVATVELNLSGWDCPSLLGDVGDPCSLDSSTEGLITTNCECTTTVDCSISLTFVSSAADDGSGSGLASIYIAGGQGPYAWTLLSPDWQALQVGTFPGSDGIMDFNGLNSGFFAVEFVDSQGCLAQIFINIP